MKTYKLLYPTIYDFENLYWAFRKARRGKRDRPDVAAFEFFLEFELPSLQEELSNETYRPGPYRHFTLYERKPDQRETNLSAPGCGRKTRLTRNYPEPVEGWFRAGLQAQAISRQDKRQTTMKAWLYVLKCADGSYYTGSTTNLSLWVAQHQAGDGSAYTRRRLPVELVYTQEFQSEHEAFLRERQVKGWSRAKKQALIRGDFERLVELSKSRSLSQRDSDGSESGGEPAA